MPPYASQNYRPPLIPTSNSCCCCNNKLLLDDHLSLVPADVSFHHSHPVLPSHSCSVLAQVINASIPTVWSFLRRFDRPQTYKHFVKSCRLVHGSGEIGSVRQIHVVSGLPAATSCERLEILDDERHILSFRIVGGEHRLGNYRSVTTLHTPQEDRNQTIVVESYVVDVPEGNTVEDTRVFVDTIVRCNLISLKNTAEAVENRRGVVS